MKYKVVRQMLICYHACFFCSVWALNMFTSNGEGGCERNSMYTLFSITIVLTDVGFANLCEVCTLVIKIGVKKLAPL